MSRPRKPFGADHPGRLPATMMKILAAEMSDPQRLRRGKQYASDGSVIDIIIEPGVVTCEVQGSRPTPYIAQLEVSAGDGMPLRRDIGTHCTCPDDSNWDSFACKHVVAAMFAFSDELLLEPELLDVWRRRTGPSHTAGHPAVPRSRGHLTLVHSDTTPARGSVQPTDDHTVDHSVHADARRPGRLDAMLSFPVGAELPDIPPLEPFEPMRAPRRQLAELLDDALGHLRIDWD